MYRFYQNSETTAWIPVQDDGRHPLEDSIKKLGGRKLTILAIDKPSPDSVPPDSLRYRGPLYFDIDVKDDLEIAIKSGRRLVKKLVDLDVPENTIEVYCSGSKGLHVLLPMTLFSTGRAVTRLPIIYKEIARQLYVEGVDFQVYSGKKGNSFRLSNLKRDDGNYRVPITVSELQELTPEGYRQLVSKPREITFPPISKDIKAPQLEILFNEAKKKANAKPTENRIPLTDVLLKKIQKEVPPCVEMLVDGKNTRNTANFNEMALQLAIYLNSTQMSEGMADSLMARMASNLDSSKYTTQGLRYEHLVGALSYQRYNPMTFSCPAMRGMLMKRPCEGCALENEADAGNVDDILSQIGLIERHSGYYACGANGEERLVSNFTMEATSAFIDVPADGTTPRREGTVIDIRSRGQFVASIITNEASWNSKSAFLREVQGFTDLVFLGSDNDVQKIKLHVFKEYENMGEVRQVHAAGIHVDTVGKSQLLTYVEPNMSVNQVRVSGTHRLADGVISPPKFSEVKTCEEADDKADRAFAGLCNINSPVQTASILGWFLASHLKQHLMTQYKQFPLINIWGNAGSGKSAVTHLMAYLTGMDMLTGDGAVNAANSTPYATLHYLSSTTTVPRIMEEYNRSKIQRKLYDYQGELFKQAWNGDLHTRGMKSGGSSLRGGGGTVKIPISSPVVIISEQAVEMPALIERTLQVMLSKASRRNCHNAFRAAKQGTAHLLTIGRALMLSALLMPTKKAAAMLEDQFQHLDEMMDDRPRYSLATVLMGLDFGLKVMEDLKLPKSQAALHKLKAELIESHQTSTVKATTSEVDAVMQTIGEMIVESEASGETAYSLTAGSHYIYDSSSETLSIAVTLCHIRYRKFMRHVNGQEPAIGTAATFQQLLQVEDYFMKKERSPISKQELYVLSIPGMASKGIDVSLFSI